MLRSSLRETAKVMLKWVSSCNTVEQLDMIRTSLDNSFLPLYEGQEGLKDQYELVYDAIEDKRKKLLKLPVPELCDN